MNSTPDTSTGSSNQDSDYVVQQGDCISSIAQQYGHFWKTLWFDAKNARLKEKRKDPNVLYPGDIVFVPEKRLKSESGQTESKHRFMLKGVPAKFVLQLLEGKKPRAGVNYVLSIEGKVFSGTTDSQGVLEHPIAPGARQGRLIIEETEEYDIALGGLDPVAEDAGVIARLANLGYCAHEDTMGSDELKQAISAFQQDYDLQATGECDDATLEKLLEIHGC